MTSKISIKKNKSITLDFAKDTKMNSVFNFLESCYPGKTIEEIIKIALIQLLKTNNLPIVNMTKDEEVEYAKAMKENETIITLKYKKDISDYVMSM
jgi:antitoxin component of RelBE/YafQ-DinJ toxin-antitoxin module